MDIIYCPFCHKKNDITHTHCQHCGNNLIPKPVTGPITTSKIGSQEDDNHTASDCEQFLDMQATNTLALFVIGLNKQFIMPAPKTILLGRGNDDNAENVCDFSIVGPRATGISRRHALIRKIPKGYSIQDLNSTNGTWLNGKILKPGQAVALQNQDTIVLAQLKLTVCFHVPEKIELTEMRLQKRNRLSLHTRKLYPNFMSVYLVPYLEAIAQLQRMLGLSDVQTLKEPRIHKIAEDRDSILVSLDLDATVKHLIIDTLLPWRESHAEFITWEENSHEAMVSEELQMLTTEIITAVSSQPSLKPQTLQNIQTAVATITTSPLEPEFSSQPA